VMKMVRGKNTPGNHFSSSAAMQVHRHPLWSALLKRETFLVRVGQLHLLTEQADWPIHRRG